MCVFRPVGVAFSTERAVDLRDEDDDTALIVSSLHGHEQAVRVLLAHGASSLIQGCSQRTALHAAAFEGHTRVVQILLENNLRASMMFDSLQ